MQTLSKQRGFVQFIPAIVSGVSAIAGLVSGSKSRKAQNEARRQQQQANRLRNFQRQIAFLQDLRQQQAIAVASQLVTSTGGESSYAKATESSQRAQAERIGAETGELNRLGEEASVNLNKAATASMNSGIYNQLSRFALSEAGGDLIKSILS